MQYDNMFKDWLRQSGINEETQIKFNLGAGVHSRLGEAIIIPVHDIDGTFLFNKYRKNPTVQNTLPKYMYDTGGSLTLYGAQFLDGVDRVLVTEGEKDTLVAWSHNIPAVSSTGGAMSFKEEWAELLAGKEVILCFDNDEAGGVGMARALKIIPWAKVMFIPSREGVKDISDYVMSGGDLHTLMGTARSYSSVEEVMTDRADRAATWRSVYFHDAYLAEVEKEREIDLRVERKKRSGDRLENAKAVPLGQIVKFGRDSKRKCIFHNEKTASMNWYKDTNTFYCFGCGKFGDSVDLYMGAHGVDFKEAVRKLNNE